MIAKIISFIRRKIFRISKYRWDYQYSRGQWDGLRTLEMERFAVADALLKKYASGGKLLEIGCGEGVFFQNLSDVDYSFYEGIDISSVAIAQTKPTAKSLFIAADMETYAPQNSPYAVIVINEALYYSKHPVELLKRYDKFLEKNGVFLIGMVDQPKHKRTWQKLSEVCLEKESAQARKGPHSWTYKIMKLS